MNLASGCFATIYGADSHSGAVALCRIPFAIIFVHTGPGTYFLHLDITIASPELAGCSAYEKLSTALQVLVVTPPFCV